MKKYIYSLLILTSIFVFNSCEDDEVASVDFVTFESTAYEFGVEIGSSSTYDIKVYTSKVSSSDRTFDVSVDTDQTTADLDYTVPSTVTIPANTNVGTLSTTISDVNIDSGASMVLTLSSSDDTYIGENITLNIFQACSENEVTLNITFDDYASETSVYIQDTNGNDYLSIDAGTWADGDASYTTTLCLPSDATYQVTIGDVYGDGLSWPADGTITLTHSGGTVLFSASGNYGYAAVGDFTL